MIAAFYGGELVWRERDRKLNELIDSTPLPAWIMTVPKVVAIFLVMVIVNFGAMLDRPRLPGGQGRQRLWRRRLSPWFILPAAIDALLLSVLAVFIQVLSPNKYVGWGILFVWFVGTIFLNNMGYSNPLYTYASQPQCAAQRFRRGRQLLEGRRDHAALLGAVRGRPAGRCASAVAARHRPRPPRPRSAGPPASLSASRSRSPALPRSPWPRPGPTPTTTSRSLNRYFTSDDPEQCSRPISRRNI